MTIRAGRLTLYFPQKCENFGELRGHFGAKFYELCVHVDSKDCEFTIDDFEFADDLVKI